MTFEQNQVYTCKLNSGEELIAKIEKTGTEWITVSDPVSVAPGPQGMGLVPSLFTAELDCFVTVNKTNISMVTESRQQVKDSYLESTTGIQTVRKQILVD